MIALRCACVLLVLGLVRSNSTPATMTESVGMNYLQKYGYMGPDNPDPMMASVTDPEVQKMALQDFQRMAGIAVTGVFDEDTRRIMAIPRCGNKDRQAMGDSARRKKRYTLQGSKWGNNRITYMIKNYTPDMSPTAALTELQRAFKVWSDVTPLEFVRVSSNPDIEILFGAGEHGDGIPFDGPGSTLAHAYFPQYGGDAHFDEDEQYTFNTSSGINLFQVAAHEFGHSLGLSHSRVDEALMAPFYRGYIPNFKLHSDDVAGIQAIYGPNVAPTMPPAPPSTTRRTTQPPPTPSPGATASSTITPPTAPPSSTTITYPDMCQISKIDAVVYWRNNDRTYMFVDDVYYRLNDYGVDRGFPRPISIDWEGLEGNLDAALESRDPYEPATMYFFKGNKYWKFYGGRRLDGYPKTIGVDGFYGLPENIDSAFVWSGNGRAYFTKGNLYYRLSNNFGTPYEDRTIDSGYPRSLTIWRGLPSEVSAVMRWKNGRTYFFAGADYHRFNDYYFQVDSGYPRSTARWWFGCSNSGIAKSTMMPPIMDEKDDSGMTVMDNGGKTPGETSAAVTQVMHVTPALLLTSLVVLLC